MKTQIKGRNVTVTPALQDYAKEVEKRHKQERIASKKSQKTRESDAAAIAAKEEKSEEAPGSA